MAKQVEISRREDPGRALAHPFRTLQREMNELFSDFFTGVPFRRMELPHFPGGFISPDIDVSETDKAFKVAAELPGLDEKDIEVSVHDGVLTVKGEKKAEKEEKGETFHRLERSYGAFQRSLSLPSGVDEGKISASFEKGILTVTVPKTAKAAAAKKKIAVKSK